MKCPLPSEVEHKGIHDIPSYPSEGYAAGQAVLCCVLVSVSIAASGGLLTEEPAVKQLGELMLVV